MKTIAAFLNASLSWLDRWIIKLIDNPVAKSVAIVLFLISLFFYVLAPYISGLYLTSNDYLYIGNFIEWFGVPYGLLLALVLVNVWTQFETTDRSFDREADAVLAIYNTFKLTKNPDLEKPVGLKIAAYIDHVQNHYFEEYMDIHTQKKQEGDELINDIRTLAGDLISDKNHEVLAAELLRLLNELIDDRGDRLSYSKQRIPRPVFYLSIIASVLWLVPFFTLSLSSLLLKLFLIGGVALIVISIILIIVDLDNPFEGTWKVEIDSWIKLSSSFGTEGKTQKAWQKPDTDLLPAGK